MTDDQKTAATRSISFTTLLGVAFIILKLCHVIDWAWIWVLAPIWIPFAIFAFILLSVLSFAFIALKKGDDERNQYEQGKDYKNLSSLDER